MDYHQADPQWVLHLSGPHVVVSGGRDVCDATLGHNSASARQIRLGDTGVDLEGRCDSLDLDGTKGIGGMDRELAMWLVAGFAIACDGREHIIRQVACL